MTVRTRNKSIPAFNLMSQTCVQKEIKRSINRNGGQTLMPLVGKRIDQVVRAHRLLLLNQSFKNVAPHIGKAQPFLSAMRLSVRNRIVVVVVFAHKGLPTVTVIRCLRVLSNRLFGRTDNFRAFCSLRFLLGHVVKFSYAT